MILLIDMGNQRLKWCTVASDLPSRDAGIAQCLAADNQAVSIIDLSAQKESSWQEQLPWSGPAPHQVWISAVSRNDVADEIRRRCLFRWGIVPVFMESPAHFDAFRNNYDRPSQLGVDRWLAALGAWTICGGDAGHASLVVIDAGTAVTVDAVMDSAFQGGTILPGLTLITDALGSRTGRIRLGRTRLGRTRPDLTRQNPARLDQSPLAISRGRSHDTAMEPMQSGSLSTAFATNSDDAVRAGAIAAVCGGVRYCVDRLVEKTAATDTHPSPPVTLFVCGGDAILVADALQAAGEGKWSPRVVPNLVLAGLYASANAELNESEGMTS